MSGWVLWHCLRSTYSVAANCRQFWDCFHVVLVLEGNFLLEKESCCRYITSDIFTCYNTKGNCALDLYGPWKGPEIPFTISGNVLHVTYFGLSLFEGPIGVHSHYPLSARNRRQLQSPELCGVFCLRRMTLCRISVTCVAVPFVATRYSWTPEKSASTSPYCPNWTYFSLRNTTHSKGVPRVKSSNENMFFFFLRRLRKLAMWLLTSFCLSVRPHGTRLPIDGFAWNLISEHFSKNMFGKVKFYQNLTRITGTVHEYLCTFMLSRWFLIKTRIIWSISFFLFCFENRTLYGIMWKLLYRRTGHRWQYNMAHALCMVDNKGYRHAQG